MPRAALRKPPLDETLAKERSDAREGARHYSLSEFLALAEAHQGETTSEAMEEQAREARLERSRNSLMDFALYYFPHYCSLPPSELHKDLAVDLLRVANSKESERMARAAPRGGAKSTWVSLIYVIYCIVFDLKKFVILISNTSDVAEQLLKDVRSELEDNERLAADFPHAVGRGPVWQVTSFITRNDTKVIALGAGKKIRGRRHKQWRPDLTILDDLESDESCRNPDQRNKTWDWLTKAVLKAKGVAVKSDVIAIGTLIHFDSVLARLLDPRKSPGWRGRTYAAVKQFASNKTLWDAWEALYCDWRLSDQARMDNAAKFYKENEAAMLEGAEVLWPEGESYLELMRMKLEEGTLAFQTEKQNQPINPSDCTFPEEWFVWGDEFQQEGQWYFKVDGEDAIPLVDCDTYAAADPSMGKLDKHSDPSAIVTIAAWPSYKLSNGEKYRRFFVVDADIARRHPNVICDQFIYYYRLRHWEKAGIETIQFQEMFADMVERAMALDRELRELTIVRMKPLTDKKLRIQKLSPFVQRGQLVFSRKLTTLYEQLRYFPLATHDDGPDALEMAMEVVGAIGWQFLSDPITGDVESRHPYDEQIRRSIPSAFEAPDAVTSCGNCANRLDRGPGKWPLCEVKLFAVKPEQPACEYYVAEPDDT